MLISREKEIKHVFSEQNIVYKRNSDWNIKPQLECFSSYKKWLPAFELRMPLGKDTWRKPQVLSKWCLHPIDKINNICDVREAPESATEYAKQTGRRNQSLLITSHRRSRPLALISLRAKIRLCHFVHRLAAADNIVEIHRKCSRITQFVAFSCACRPRVHGHRDLRVRQSLFLW